MTESAPELESAIAVDPQETGRKLIEVRSNDKQLTSSSNSLKPIMRGQIFRKQVTKKQEDVSNE